MADWFNNSVEKQARQSGIFDVNSNVMAKEKKKKADDQRKELPIVAQLEERAKLGFRTEMRFDPSDFEPTYSLVCDDPDVEKKEPVRLTPYCTVSVLSTLIQGAIYLQPLIVTIMRKQNANHEEKPADKSGETSELIREQLVEQQEELKNG